MRRMRDLHRIRWLYALSVPAGLAIAVAAVIGGAGLFSTTPNSVAVAGEGRAAVPAKGGARVKEFAAPGRTSSSRRAVTRSARGGTAIRLVAGTFDPQSGRLPTQRGIPLRSEVTLARDVAQPWLVQVRGHRFAEATRAVQAAGGTIVGSVPDDTYMVRATPRQRADIARSPAVRWIGYFQPAWRVPAARRGKKGLLDLSGVRTYRVYVLSGAPEAATLVRALERMRGVTVVQDAGAVLEVRATASRVPAIASHPAVQWVGLKPKVVPLNVNARWVNDTGVRDVFAATAAGRLSGAGQTAAVADTGVNYTYDLNKRAHVAFRDCNANGTGCKEAIYTQQTPGNAPASIDAITDNNTAHRKMVAYFDLGNAGPNMFDESSHGSHTAGSVTGDQPPYNAYTGADGLAPAANHVHQNIADTGGGLAGLPADDYDLWRQAYRPRNPAGVLETSGATGNPGDYTTNYRPLEDARTHNNSYGLLAPVIDEGSAVRLDRFVWDHEDMVIVVSAGNNGPDPGSIGSPSVAKNELSSGASANGRQPMVSIDSMASFSSHGPTGDGRLGVDLATPGQIVVSAKGGSTDGYHTAQGTSMSGPILTGLATLVRQYFFDGYAAAGGDGFAAGTAATARQHNPSAALVKAALINGAVRMRGFYTGDDGTQRAFDGQWPSAGQGFGRVNLDNSLYFANDPTNNWYADVYRGDTANADANLRPFPVSNTPASRSFTLHAEPGQPLDVTLAWTDAPNVAPAGTPALVNNLDLVVTGPGGATYVGNNMNSRANPGVAVAETLNAPAPRDLSNLTERVRVANPAAGDYTITVAASPIITGNQGFALAASGSISPAGGPTFQPGPPLQRDGAGTPAVSNVRVETISANTAKVFFETNEPTTATAQVSIAGTPTTFVDSYNAGPGGFPGLNEGTVETSTEYADKPVVGTKHEILITGLAPGQLAPVTLKVKDLAATPNEATHVTVLRSPSKVFQADAADSGQLYEDPATAAQAASWRTGTQLYASDTGAGNGILGAFMFRAPTSGINPNDITGAVVELTSAHNWIVPYSDDRQLKVELLDDSVEANWGSQNYRQIHDAAFEARVYPETTHRRGAYEKYAFTFACSDLQALKDTLSAAGGERRAAFRYESTIDPKLGLFSMDFGFNRRSRGPDLRPKLILFTGQSGYPDGRPCDPNTPAPAISELGIHDGRTADAVTVSWETDVPSDSIVLFREQGTADWTQVATPALTKIHQVEVFGLSREKEYEFVVRSAACNGATTTDTNGGAGYDFFYPPVPSFTRWFTGLPTDQATKNTATPTATFTDTAPAGPVSIQQTQTAGANPNSAQNPLAIFWSGPVSTTLPAGSNMTFDWFFNSRFGNVFVTTGVLTVFAGNPPAVPFAVRHQQNIDLEVFLSATPVRNRHTITLQNAINQPRMVVQLTTPFINNDFSAFYGSTLHPSSFSVPLGQIPDLPLVGPVPPPSAGATGLVAPPTRSGPATAADIAAGTGLCAIAGENATPDAVDDAATVQRGGSVNIAVLANDTDANGDDLAISSFTQPAHGSVADNGNGTLKYTHDNSTTTSDSFQYTISDGRGGSDTATVRITVTDPPPPPPPAEGDKTMGGGWLVTNDDGKINYGFNAKQTDAGVEGHLQLNDKQAGVKIDVKQVTALGAVGDRCGAVPEAANSLQFEGNGTYNGNAASFRVCVQDNGEASGTAPDRFYLHCLSGCGSGYDTAGRTADAGVDGGNVQVRRTTPVAAGGSQAAPTGTPQATTMILDPVLLTEGLVGQAQLFTVKVYDQYQEPLAKAKVTLTRTTSSGAAQTLSGVTGLAGTVVFTLANAQTVSEYVAKAGKTQSNAIEVTPLLGG
ncbi:MAG: S8 family serine peptidase [Thermoleophilia bacterium]|nr:S8 family serine peptidase [Thermoleophilia bacterium]